MSEIPRALLYAFDALPVATLVGFVLWAVWQERVRVGGLLGRTRKLPGPTADALERLAGGLGLAFEGERAHPHVSMVGEYRGYSVSVRVERLASRRSDPMPALRLGVEVTPRALHPPGSLADSDLPPDCALTWRSWRCEQVVFPPLEVRPRLDEAIDHLAPLDAAAAAPWEAVGAARGLRGFGLNRSGLPTLAGDVGALAVEAEPRGMRPDVSWRVRVVPARRVRGLHLIAADGDPGGGRTGNPVFDRFVRVDGPGAPWLGPWLAADERSGPLLEALHTHPGSRVSDGVVWLTAPATDPLAFAALLDEALALARVLHAPEGSPSSV
jgi:hypothetical protein